MSMRKMEKLFLAFSAAAACTAVFCLDLCAEETAAQAQVKRETIVSDAKKYIGCPYADGAVGPDSFDCSGFIYFIARESVQVQLPRTAHAMYSFVRIIPDSRIEPGDLVFFKTTENGSISHVGLYIGKKQFIHAASDGPNNGVIASSLNESYWKTHYAGAGQFLKSGRTGDGENSSSDDEVTEEDVTTGDSVPETGHSSGTGSSGSFTDGLACSFSASADWSLFTTQRFMPNFRGLATEADLFMTKWKMNPGAGVMLRWNYGVRAFEMPVVFSLAFADFMRVYAGPVFTFGKCTLPDTDTEIRGSVFPGIFGVSFILPSFTKGTFKVQIIQDICYTVFNDIDGAALVFTDAAAAGLVFSTGVRVTFPFSVFTK